MRKQAQALEPPTAPTQSVSCLPHVWRGGGRAARQALTCTHPWPQPTAPLRSPNMPAAPPPPTQALLLALCLWPFLPAATLATSPLPQGVPPPPVAFLRSPAGVPREQVALTAAGLFDRAYLKQVRGSVCVSHTHTT